TPIHSQHAAIAAVNKVVAVRDEVAGAMTFKQFLLSVSQTLKEAYSNQKYPFERIIDLLGIAALPNQCALFNLVVLVDNINNRENIRHLKHDATLAFRMGEGRLSGVIEYNERLFKEQSVETFGRHFGTALDAMFKSADDTIDRLDLASQGEKRRLIHEFNDTRADYPREGTVCLLFEEQVGRFPMSIAVSFENEHVTYGLLDDRANQLAHYLGRAGVGQDVLVGLCVERSIEMVIAMLGVIKAGGAYVPLDPELPKERLLAILSDAGLAFVLTQERFRHTLMGLPLNVFCFESEKQALERESTASPGALASGGNLVYVIYTSGSTGKPKGVMISQESLCNHMVWMQLDYPLDRRDRVLQKTPYTFDASVWEFYLPLLAGATLVMARPNGHLDNGYLARSVSEASISVIQLVPTMLGLFLEEDGIERLNGLRIVFCGGEALTVELQDRVFSRLCAE
ncbi:MAG: AMP-binding protein, partial [Blastocatellia bacterium]